jgi:hypothetical protein
VPGRRFDVVIDEHQLVVALMSSLVTITAAAESSSATLVSSVFDVQATPRKLSTVDAVSVPTAFAGTTIAK